MKHEIWTLASELIMAPGESCWLVCKPTTQYMTRILDYLGSSRVQDIVHL
jgi:hypothetical protein